MREAERLRIVRIERGEGIPAGEVQGMLGMGWRCIPKVTVSIGTVGSGIVLPGQVGGGSEVVDVWYVPEPVVPAGMVIAALQAAAKWDSELVVTDFLGRHLLGMEAQEVLRFGREEKAK